MYSWQVAQSEHKQWHLSQEQIDNSKYALFFSPMNKI